MAIYTIEEHQLIELGKLHSYLAKKHIELFKQIYEDVKDGLGQEHYNELLSEFAEIDSFMRLLQAICGNEVA